jgi:formylglycine-generating enzyme required for sulfatase activity
VQLGDVFSNRGNPVNSSTVTISQPFYIQEAKVSVDQYQQFDPSCSGSRYVEGVTWYDAVAFCDWLSQREGVTYRLPTEAEWEYAFKSSNSVQDMASFPGEWVYDWHGMYPHDDQVDPVGSEHGIARVVRGGGLDEDSSYYRHPANRAGIAPGFTGDHPIGFRVVRSPMPTTTPWPYVAPFAQQGVKQTTRCASQGPDPDVPYFRQIPILPIPPENSDKAAILASGLYPAFRGHNHSPIRVKPAR